MDLITTEFRLFVWSSAVLLMIILPVVALISILKNRFKDNNMNTISAEPSATSAS